MLKKLANFFKAHHTEKSEQSDATPVKSKLIINLPALAGAISCYGKPDEKYDANKISAGKLDSLLQVILTKKPGLFNSQLLISDLSAKSQNDMRSFLYYVSSIPQTTFIVDLKTDVEESLTLIKEGRFSQGIVDVKDYQDIRETPKPLVVRIAR